MMLPAVTSSITVVVALTRCALFLSHMWFKNLTVERVTLFNSGIEHKFELGHNAAEVTRNICYVKSEGTVITGQ